MNGDDGFSFIVVGAIVILCLAGLYFLLADPVERAECRIHGQYALTQADTAAIVRKTPLCARVLYPVEAK